MSRNGKQRAQRIDRQYHTLADRFVQRNRWFGVIGFLAAIAYSSWLFSSRGALQVSTGDLSRAHFAWNKTGCENCHLPFLPIRKDAFGGEVPETISQNNHTCNSTCHSVTDHFGRQTNPKVLASESCSSCHREHLGLNRRLVDVADNDCVRCHLKLEKIAVVTNTQFASVSNFSNSDGHPVFPFEKLGKDPGTIKFSHTQHLRLGQPKKPGDRTEKHIGNIPEKYRKQYQDRLGAGDLIQLRCSDCHERDVALPGYEELESFSPVLKDGRMGVRSNSHMLYKPIEYEKHCVACHDLGGVEHGLDRVQTQAAIESLMPVRLFESLKRRGIESKLTDVEIEGHSIRLNSLLTDKAEGCIKCHSSAEATSSSIVQASNIVSRWLKDATFTHGAHLMVSCKDCHSAAYVQHERSIDSEMDASQIMIPGITSCRACHVQDAQERSSQFANNKHVVSADCVDCHRYHVDPPMSLSPSEMQSASLEQVRALLSVGKSP